MRYNFLPLILALFLLTCNKQDENKIPDIPENDTIDINGDSTDDFMITYTQIATTDIPPSSQNIYGDIIPLNDNQVLIRQLTGYLFLEMNDTIRKENNTSAEWCSCSGSVISINGDNDHWDDEWNIMSDLSAGYYLAFKLEDENNEEIGWMSLDMNTDDGRITIADHEITASDELIILR